MTSISLSWPVALQSLEGLDQGSRQPDLALEPGEAEQPADLAAVADHLEAAPVRGGAPGCADDRAESRGVHETDLIQVGDDRPTAVRQRVQALAQPGHGGDIDLTCHSDNGTSWFAADPDSQARVHDRSPPGARIVARYRSAYPPDNHLPASSSELRARTLMAEIGSAGRPDAELRGLPAVNLSAG